MLVIWTICALAWADPTTAATTAATTSATPVVALAEGPLAFGAPNEAGPAAWTAVVADCLDERSGGKLVWAGSAREPAAEAAASEDAATVAAPSAAEAKSAVTLSPFLQRVALVTTEQPSAWLVLSTPAVDAGLEALLVAHAAKGQLLLVTPPEAMQDAKWEAFRALSAKLGSKSGPIRWLDLQVSWPDGEQGEPLVAEQSLTDQGQAHVGAEICAVIAGTSKGRKR